MSNTTGKKTGKKYEKAVLSKTSICASMAKKMNKPRAEISEIVNAFLDEIKDAVSKGHEVSLNGFGRFVVYKRKARTLPVGLKSVGDIPVRIPEKCKVKFKPSQQLTVNEGNC